MPTRPRTAARWLWTLLALAAPAPASPVDQQLNPGQFGNLRQNQTNFPALGCAATACVNSFTYLQNAFPSWYGTSLIHFDPASTANSLMTPSYMGPPGPGGTKFSAFVRGKENYLRGTPRGAMPYTELAGMVFDWDADPEGNGRASPPPPPTWMISGGWPSEAFFDVYLGRKADIEVLLSFADGGGHYVTVTGFVTDFSGSGYLKYIDPLDGLPHQAVIQVPTTTGPIEILSYTDPISHVERTGRIEAAVAEVPAPGAGALFVLAGWAAGRRRRAS